MVGEIAATEIFTAKLACKEPSFIPFELPLKTDMLFGGGASKRNSEMRSSSKQSLTVAIVATAIAITSTTTGALPMPRAGKADLQGADFGLLTQVEAVKSRLNFDFRSKQLSSASRNRIRSALNGAHLELMKNETYAGALRRRDASKVRQMLEAKSGVPIGELRFGGDSTILLILAVILIGAGIF